MVLKGLPEVIDGAKARAPGFTFPISISTLLLFYLLVLGTVTVEGCFKKHTCKYANGARLLVRGLVKRTGKARPDRLSNSTLEFHQTTYQKPYAIQEVIQWAQIQIL